MQRRNFLANVDWYLGDNNSSYRNSSIRVYHFQDGTDQAALSGTRLAALSQSVHAMLVTFASRRTCAERPPNRTEAASFVKNDEGIDSCAPYSMYYQICPKTGIIEMVM